MVLEATTSAPRRHRGRLDRVEPGLVTGWAWIENAEGARAELEFLQDGELLGTVVADLHREDLEAARIGDGHHGFRFEPPPEVTLNGETLSVVFRGTDLPLRPPSAVGQASPVDEHLRTIVEELRLLKLATGHGLTQVRTRGGDPRLDEILKIARWQEGFLSVGFTQTLADRVLQEVSDLLEGTLDRRFRLLMGLNLLLLVLVVLLGGLLLWR